MPNVRRYITSITSAGGLAILAALAIPAIGQAAPAPPTACSVGPLSQPFRLWGDNATYEMVAGGDFEGSLDGWTLQGGATQSSGSEQFGVTGSVGSSSLELPQGAVAVAPPTCVNIPHPTARLFVQSSSPGARLQVQAVYDNGAHSVTIPAGPAVKSSADWQPSQALNIHPVVIPALHGQGTALITLQFTATHGTVFIDDVFVDPWHSG